MYGQSMKEHDCQYAGSWSKHVETKFQMYLKQPNSFTESTVVVGMYRSYFRQFLIINAPFLPVAGHALHVTENAYILKLGVSDMAGGGALDGGSPMLDVDFR